LAEGDRAGIAALAHALGYAEGATPLLRQAVTHKSYANEQNGNAPYNERLEFLGDAVLGLVVAEALMKAHPGLEEGKLSRLRASLVNARSLADAARARGVGDVLCLGKGEERTGGREKDSLLADAYEAMLGAIYLDLGLEAARAVVHADFDARIAAGEPAVAHRDHKTALQELAQARYGEAPDYRLVDESGPDHDKQFSVETWIDGACVGRGQGRSKKQAERRAAREAWRTLTGG
jgi:ribonuclease-3